MRVQDLVFIILMAGLARQSFASVPQIDERRLQLESTINQQLAQELEGLLPAGSFGVFASVDLSITPVNQVMSGERLTTKQTSHEGGLDLPGFEEPTRDRKPQQAGQDRQRYEVVHQERIRKLTLRVVFDQSLPEKSVQVAKQMLVKRLRSSFGSNAQLDAYRSDLNIAEPQKTAQQRQELKSLLIKAGLLAGLGLLVLGLGLLLWRKLARRPVPWQPAAQVVDAEAWSPALPGEKKPAGLLEPVSEIDATSQPEAAQELGEGGAESGKHKDSYTAAAIRAIIEEISQQPLVSRSFFRQLPEKRKRSLWPHFHNSPMAHQMASLMHWQPDGGQTEVAEPCRLQDVVEEMRHYRHLSQVQLDQKLGYLHFLTPNEVESLLQNCSLEDRYAVLMMLPQETVAKVLGLLPADQSDALTSLLFAGTVCDPQVINKLHEELLPTVDALMQQILLPQSNKNSMLEAVIQQASHDPKRLERLLADQPQLKKRYHHYLATLEDFMVEGEEVQSAVMEAASNEVLARSVLGMKPEQRTQILSLLPSMRREIVEFHLEDLQHQPSRHENSQAGEELLAQYREVLRQRGGRIAGGV